MPQTLIEKKFCSLFAACRGQNLAPIICEKLAVAEFLEIQKNLAGGAE